MIRTQINMSQPVNWNHPLNRGLRAWWVVLPQWRRGTVWRNLVRGEGVSYDGVMTSGVATGDWNTEQIKNNHFGSVYFDKGGNNNWVDCGAPASTIIGGGNTFTVAYWSRDTTNSAPSNRNYHVGTINGAGTQGFELNREDDFASFNLLRFLVGTGSLAQVEVSHSDWVNWHHFGGCYDGPNSTMRIFIDGNMSGSTTQSGNVSATSSNMAIGCNNEPSLGPELFNRGWLNFVRIWNRPLSDPEFAQEFRVTQLPFCPLFNWINLPVVRSSGITGAITEAVNTGDTFSGTIIGKASILEAINLNDVQAATAVLLDSITEDVNTGDTQTSAAVYPVSQESEGVTTGDAQDNTKTAPVSVTEAVNINDTQSNVAVLKASTLDGVDLNDVQLVIAILQTDITDAASVNDTQSTSATLGASITEDSNTGDDQQVSAVLGAAITDGLATGDSQSVTAVLLSSITEDVNTGDSQQGTVVLGDIQAAITEGVAVDDSLSVVGILGGSIAEAVTTGDVQAGVVVVSVYILSLQFLGETLQQSVMLRQTLEQSDLSTQSMGVSDMIRQGLT